MQTQILVHFARARGSIAETHVNIGDTFARARGTANTLDSAGDASSNSKAIGIPDTRHVSPSIAPDIPNRGMIRARPLKLRDIQTTTLKFLGGSNP